MPNQKGRDFLEQRFAQLRIAGKRKPFDCLLGLSGGVDSSYLALVAKEFGLRPLVFHVDAGWNSEAAVSNIERVVEYCNFELFTEVLNWREVRDLQLAYLKAGVPNQDAVQDHGFFATLYHFAVKENVRFVLNGGNIATESVLPSSWHHGAMDEVNLRAIYRAHGTGTLRDFKTIGFFEYYIYYPYIRRMRVVRPLNFLPYSRECAISELKTKTGYKDYGRKHSESIFTKFFQNYYLPVRFGYDKRRPHLSSRILSQQISREQALREIEMPLYDPDELRQDFHYIATKLEIPEEELQAYIEAPLRRHEDYANWNKLYDRMKRFQALIKSVSGRSLGHYS